ncbi:DUF3331 domain-containing protein [Paraburkholderia kirstenboschensis]|jgi:hypothetical protein|uniref:DUF3331 domain-containing protein n=1 Tax=Paraburkholderia kirstenboschensis TaxID=1245436 RepID=UPI003744183A
MGDVIEIDCAWFHTVALLSRDSATTFRGHRPAHADCRHEAYKRCAIRVLERQSRTTATVAWSDSTACRYGEQLWQRCIARKTGICALSGQAIAKGDAVYSPRVLRRAPQNIDAMILASVMEATTSDEGV